MIFNKYPYTDFHEMNLDWFLVKFRELLSKFEAFVDVNTIHFANPILWDITSQYTPNTVVVNDGLGYVSIKPVPAGIEIDNTEYWTVIFDEKLIHEKIMEAFTLKNYETALTAPEYIPTATLFWLNGYLSSALTDIAIDTEFTENVNYKIVSVADIFNVLQIVGEERQYRNTGTHFYKRNILGVNYDTFDADSKLLFNETLLEDCTSATFIVDDIPGSNLLYLYLNVAFKANTPAQAVYKLTEDLDITKFGGRFFKAATFLGVGNVATRLTGATVPITIEDLTITADDDTEVHYKKIEGRERPSTQVMTNESGNVHIRLNGDGTFYFDYSPFTPHVGSAYVTSLYISATVSY